MGDEIADLGAAYRYALVRSHVGPPPEVLRARMGLGPDTRVRHLICMHFADGQP